ncbi:hypothetical protein [Sagittula salina]|uniref:Uncharacterized protein n=1 Tax=Sagittula salina TaxID=2820268 RepID=A0A940S0U2_9RHOB|nr:hypothetical protein [Sagittula salina]MBP0483453.1 hypothetical protein [Sagittula salina]
MKRFLTATALMSIVATGAFAATDYEATTINTYLPDVDVSTLNDEQVGALMNIAGSNTEAEKEEQMRAYLGEFNSPEMTTSVKVVPAEEAAEMEAEGTMEPADPDFYDNVIASFLPDVSIETLTDEQKSALVNIANGDGNENDKKREMEAYLSADNG